MRGTVGVEGTTVTAHRRAEDVSAPRRRRAGALPVGAPTTLVADTVQAHVAPQKGRSLSSERSPPPPRRKRGERDRRQNKSRSRSRGAKNGRGAAKGRLVGARAGAEAARGARVHVDATTKVRATCSRFNAQLSTLITSPVNVIRLSSSGVADNGAYHRKKVLLIAPPSIKPASRRASLVAFVLLTRTYLSFS